MRFPPASRICSLVAAVIFFVASATCQQIGIPAGSSGTPNTYVFTHDGGWSPPVTSPAGSVSFFTANNLSPLFTASVATPDTAPVLSFSLDSTSPYYIFGNLSSSSANPAMNDFSAFMSHFNGVIYANDPTYAGTDMGASISNALAAAYTAGGGTVDARGFACPTNCHIGTANLTVGDFTHPVTLLLPSGTIARDTISGTGKSAQVLIASTSVGAVTIRGAGKGVTIISGPSDVTAMQQANNAGAGVSSANLSGFSVKDTGTVTAGSATLELGGPNPDGSRGDDTLSFRVNDVATSGADIGILWDSQHGCICYNKTYDVDPAGKSFGQKFMNDSGFEFGFNSNQFYAGVYGGSIGLFTGSGVHNLFVQPDFENNTNAAGTVLAVQAHDGGTGYVVGDIVTATAGCTVNPTFTVAYVTAGVVGVQGHPPLTITTAGSGCAAYGTQIATTGGSGTGLTVDFQSAAYEALVGSGSLVLNPYEEAGGADFICGQGNMVLGAFFSSNGAGYSPNYCNNFSGDQRYVSVDSNMALGAGAVPSWLSAKKGIIFGSGYTYNPGNPYSQINFTVVGSAPSGACNANSVEMTTAGAIYYCNAGTWTLK